MIFLDIGDTLLTNECGSLIGTFVRRAGITDTSTFRTRVFTSQPSVPQIADLLKHCGSRLSYMERLRIVMDVIDSQYESTPIPGADTLIATLREERIPFGFITNIWAPFLDRFRSVFPVTEPVFASCELGVMKPDVRIYQEALTGTKTLGHKCLMVGDSYEKDIAPAKSLYMRTFLVQNGEQKWWPEPDFSGPLSSVMVAVRTHMLT